MLATLAHFKQDESGAISVDFIPLVAATVGLGLSVMAGLSGGVANISSDTSGQIEGLSGVVTRNGGQSSWFDAIAGGGGNEGGGDGQDAEEEESGEDQSDSGDEDSGDSGESGGEDSGDGEDSGESGGGSDNQSGGGQSNGNSGSSGNSNSGSSNSNGSGNSNNGNGSSNNSGRYSFDIPDQNPEKATTIALSSDDYLTGGQGHEIDPLIV